MKTKNVLQSLRNYHFIIVISLMIIFAGLEVMFLYNYVYLQLDVPKITTSDTKAVSGQVNVSDFKLLDILHNAKQKSRPIPGDVRDPFVSLSTVERDNTE